MQRYRLFAGLSPRLNPCLYGLGKAGPGRSLQGLRAPASTRSNLICQVVLQPHLLDLVQLGFEKLDVFLLVLEDRLEQ